MPLAGAPGPRLSTLARWDARPRPQRSALEGRFCRLEPLDPARHGNELFAAAMAPGAEERFRYLSDSPQDRTAFEGWLARAAASEDPLFFAVIDAATLQCGGRQSLMRITPEHGVIEVGHVLWGPALSRTPVATEAVFLFARHIFEDLGYRRFEWKCDSMNAPSRRAAQRFGFAYEGTFRQHMVTKGRNRDTAWFAMTDGDWPAVRAAFTAWLDRSNFDAQGRQVRRLEELRRSQPLR